MVRCCPYSFRRGKFLVLSDSGGFLQSQKFSIDLLKVLIDACGIAFNKGHKMRIINRKVSQLILAERSKLGLTQKQLAIRLGLRSGQYVHNIEKLQCNFPPKKIAKLSLALSIPLEKIKYAMMEDYIEAVKSEIEKSI